MKTEGLAKTAEFDFSLVFKTKFKRLLRNLLCMERNIKIVFQSGEKKYAPGI